MSIPHIRLPVAEASLNDELVPEQWVADRWRMKIQTLRNWRSRMKGPPYLKIGALVRYRMRDILAYETAGHAGWSIRSLSELIRSTPGVDTYTLDAVVEHVRAHGYREQDT